MSDSRVRTLGACAGGFASRPDSGARPAELCQRTDHRRHDRGGEPSRRFGYHREVLSAAGDCCSRWASGGARRLQDDLEDAGEPIRFLRPLRPLSRWVSAPPVLLVWLCSVERCTVPCTTGRWRCMQDSRQRIVPQRHGPGGEMANTADSKSAAREGLRVRVPPRA
jgi:hypothetical protein